MEWQHQETPYLAQAVYDNQCCTQEVAAGWILANDVLVPHLDGHQSTKELTELFDKQIKLSLSAHTHTHRQITALHIMRYNSDNMVCVYCHCWPEASNVSHMLEQKKTKSHVLHPNTAQ